MRHLKKTNCMETESSWNDKTYFKYGVVSSYKSVTWAVNVQRDYHGKIILVSLYARVDKPGAGAELRHICMQHLISSRLTNGCTGSIAYAAQPWRVRLKLCSRQLLVTLPIQVT